MRHATNGLNGQPWFLGHDIAFASDAVFHMAARAASSQSRASA